MCSLASARTTELYTFRVCVLWCEGHVSVIEKRLRKEKLSSSIIRPWSPHGRRCPAWRLLSGIPLPPYTLTRRARPLRTEATACRGTRWHSCDAGRPSRRGSGPRKEAAREGRSGLGGPSTCTCSMHPCGGRAHLPDRCRLQGEAASPGCRATLPLPAHQDLGETEPEPGRQPPGTASQKQEGRGQRCVHTARRLTQSAPHNRGRPSQEAGATSPPACRLDTPALAKPSLL